MRLAEEFGPDIVISDIRLPDVDGYALLAKFRGIDKLQKTLFVAWSGDTSPHHGERAMEAGFDHHLRKPINIDRLRKLLA